MRLPDPRILAAALLLVGLVGAAVAALLADRRRRAVSARLALVASGYGRGRNAVQVSRPLRQSARAPAPASTRRRLLGLIALDPSATDQHPAPWRLVVALAALLGTVAAVKGVGLLGPGGAALGAAAFIGICRLVFTHGRRRHRERLYTQLPDALALVVRAVRAGIPVSEAVRSVAAEVPEPTCGEFSTVAAELAIGTPLDTALWALAGRVEVPEYAFFAVALTLQAQTGGSLTETLENLADVVRKRTAIRARGLALAAEARTSAAVLTGVPVLTGVALVVLNADYMSILFTDPRGHGVLMAAGGMLLFGTLTIRTLIRRSLA